MGVHLLILKAAWSNFWVFAKSKQFPSKPIILENHRHQQNRSPFKVYNIVNKKNLYGTKKNYASWKCLEKEIVRFRLQND